MSQTPTLRIDEIRHELAKLRAAVNFALEMVEGVERDFPDTELNVQQTDSPIKGWPPCQKPPCQIGKAGLTKAADVIRTYSNNAYELLSALQSLQNFENVAYGPRSFPVSDSKAPITQIEVIPGSTT